MECELAGMNASSLAVIVSRCRPSVADNLSRKPHQMRAATPKRSQLGLRPVKFGFGPGDVGGQARILLIQMDRLVLLFSKRLVRVFSSPWRCWTCCSCWRCSCSRCSLTGRIDQYIEAAERENTRRSYSPWCSRTSRTARAFTFCGYGPITVLPTLLPLWYIYHNH